MLHIQAIFKLAKPRKKKPFSKLVLSRLHALPQIRKHFFLLAAIKLPHHKSNKNMIIVEFQLWILKQSPILNEPAVFLNEFIQLRMRLRGNYKKISFSKRLLRHQRGLISQNFS